MQAGRRFHGIIPPYPERRNPGKRTGSPAGPRFSRRRKKPAADTAPAAGIFGFKRSRLFPSKSPSDRSRGPFRKTAPRRHTAFFSPPLRGPKGTPLRSPFSFRYAQISLYISPRSRAGRQTHQRQRLPGVSSLAGQRRIPPSSSHRAIPLGCMGSPTTMDR